MQNLGTERSNVMYKKHRVVKPWKPWRSVTGGTGVALALPEELVLQEIDSIGPRQVLMSLGSRVVQNSSEMFILFQYSENRQ